MNGIFLYLIRLIMPLIPETRGFRFKRLMLRLAGAHIGSNVRICSSAHFIGTGQLSIGNNTWIGHHCLISATSSIQIGANCDLAPNVYIGNGTHLITPDKRRIADIEISKDIIIGNGCWLCANSTILPGVEIGDKCVVAAGAVVTQSNKSPLCLLAGIPAKVKKEFHK